MIGTTWETAGALSVGTTAPFSRDDMDNIYGTWFHGFFTFTTTVDSEVTLITSSAATQRMDLDVMIGPDWDNGYYVTWAYGSNFDNNHASLFFAAQAGVAYHVVYWVSAPEPADTFQLIFNKRSITAIRLG